MQKDSSAYEYKRNRTILSETGTRVTAPMNIYIYIYILVQMAIGILDIGILGY